jgi:hypothetical protein
MKVFEALYNPMVEESSYETLSVHETKEGAQKVIDEHKKNQFKKWKRLYPTKDDEPFDFGTFEDWDIREIKVLT